MTLRVLITCHQLQRTIDAHHQTFQEADVELRIPPVIQQLTEDELIRVIPGVDGVIVGDDPLTARVLASADRLRVISKWGVGVDNIDLAAARDLGIAVANTPGVFGEEVADVVIGYLVMLARRLHRIDNGVRGGAWPKLEGVSLSGRTLGVIGLGDIGQAVVKRAVAMGMRVMGTEVRADRAAEARRLGAEIAPLTELLRSADVVSLNCPLTADNRHMIDAAAIELMRPGAWIINTARGPLIDEAALIAALVDGRIGAVALDVFEQEPLPADSPLRTIDSAILGSHNSSNTAEAVHRTSVRAIENLLAGLAAGTA